MDENGGRDSRFVNTNVALPAQFLQSLNEMRLQRKLCDVFLKVGNENIAAHRVVLAANSPYFYAMFAKKGDIFFTETAKPEIDLLEVDSSGAKAVIDYFYTASIELNCGNFEAVFSTANMWHVEFILKICEDFLERELSNLNCLGIQALVNNSIDFSDNLRRLVDSFVNFHFMEVCKEEEFLSVSKDYLETVLLKDELCVNSEKVLFECVLRWLKHDFNKRCCYAVKLVSAIRIGLLGEDFIQETIFGEMLIMKNLNLREIFENVLCYLKGDPHMQLPDYFTRKRKYQVLYVCGGFSNNSNRLRQPVAVELVEFLDLSRDEWDEFPEATLTDSTQKLFFKFVIGNRYVYAVANSKVTRFCLEKLVWEELYVELEKSNFLDVKNAGLCFNSGCVYAIGGASRAKKFCPSSLQWLDISSHNQEHCLDYFKPGEHFRPGVCVHRGDIYVIGGCDRSYSEGTVLAESFCAESGEWTVKADMPTARWGLEALSLSYRIFAIGGYDPEERSPLNTVEIYTPTTDTWETALTLNVPRRRFGAAVVNDTIYVVGGREVESVEYYDEIKGQWVIVNGLVANRFDCTCLSLPPPHCLSPS